MKESTYETISTWSNRKLAQEVEKVAVSVNPVDKLLVRTVLQAATTFRSHRNFAPVILVLARNDNGLGKRDIDRSSQVV